MRLRIKYFLHIALLLTYTSTFSQKKKDSTLAALVYTPISLDSFMIKFISRYHEMPRFYHSIEHKPDKKDYRRYRKYKWLVDQQPTKKNHEIYSSLAYSLWALNKIPEAEKMYLTIINSHEDFYTDNYYYSSDVPGDTTKNLYGYGSFSYSYKNHAALRLSEMYIEQKNFDKALQYLEDAVHKYKETYTCGTGYHMQLNYYNFLYANCYQGLNRNRELFDLLVPDCLSSGSDTFIINAIRILYTQQQIEEYMAKAVNSLEFTLDTIPFYPYTVTLSNGKASKSDSVPSYSGSAFVMLFDQKVYLRVHSSENKDLLTREKMIADFKDSYFYKTLLKIKEVEVNTEEEPATNM